MEEFIPVFNEEKNVLVRIDEFEEQIEIINKLSKQYDDLKKEIKEQMIRIGKENDLDQVKWTTPKGIKITCSIGREAEFETQTIKTFSESLLKDKFPEIYEQCIVEKEQQVAITKPSNDRLVITLPKGE